MVPLTLTIESGTGSATIDGVQYNSLFFHGFLELATAPSKLTLPSGSGDFSRFVLFGFGGQLNACPSSPSGLGCSSADIATFMIGAGGPDGFVSFRNEGGRYTLNSATFNNCCAAPVPEPQSFILLSTGALAVAGRLIRTRRRQW